MPKIRHLELRNEWDVWQENSKGQLTLCLRTCRSLEEACAFVNYINGGKGEIFPAWRFDAVKDAA